MNVLTRKGAAVAACAVIASAGSAAAYAYFTSTGTADGRTTVGSATAWAVTGAAGGVTTPASTGTMLPGTGSSALVYRITNAAASSQSLTTVSVTPASSGGNIIDDATGNPVAGCTATWFSAAAATFKASDGTTTVTLPVTVAASDYVTGTSTVSMSEPGVSQNACQGHFPRMTISVS
jgi:hypothetical protein